MPTKDACIHLDLEVDHHFILVSCYFNWCAGKMPHRQRIKGTGY